jgi:ABC-type branched-subunit amino acid transport system substrate-binding protein
MGADEAARSAALFGRAVVLVEGTDADALASTGRVQAIVGGFSAEECGALAEAAQRHGAVYVDVGCDADALRGRGCRPWAYHVAPSAAMDSDAVRLAGMADGRALAWDARLAKFGADALNDRFRSRYGQGMDGAAWAGWFAVKALFEATERARSTSPGALIRYLDSDAAQFDGHKGRPLSFRPWDHQLRQPMYVVSPADPSADPVEVPRAAPGSETPSKAFLDQLGTPAARSACMFEG